MVNIFNKIKNKEHEKMIISLFSILSLFPFAFFLKVTILQIQSTKFSGITPEQLDAILNKTLLSWDVLIPFLVGLIAWVGNTSISLFYYSKGKITLSFTLLSLALGGLSLHLFYLLFVYIKNKLYKSKAKSFKSPTYKHLTLITMLLCFTTPLVANILNKNNPNAAVVGHKIKLSLDPQKPNLIEIFSDGFFRRAHTESIQKEKTLKDFTIFDKYIADSSSTYSTVTTIWGDLDKYNKIRLFHERKDKNIPYVDLVQKIYFWETFQDHMNKETDPHGTYKDNINIINPINIANQVGYNTATAGDARMIKTTHPNWNVTNWAGARDSIGLGINDRSPDGMSYHWLNQNMVPGKNKPARIYISDLITHPPIMNNKEGKFNSGAGTRQEQWMLVRQKLIELVKTLKSIEDPATHINAYDNTMIIMYGDHKDHTFVTQKTGLNGRAEYFESLMVAKYPNQHHPNKAVVSDRVVYSPQVSAIIKDFILNQDPQFIDKNNMFQPGTAHWAMLDKDSVLKVHYDKNPCYNSLKPSNLEPEYSLSVVKDGNDKPMIIENPEKSIEALSKEVYRV